MLDRDKCDDILARLVDPKEVDAFFICGPGPMMDAAEAAIEAHGVPRERIHVERFTAGRPSAAVAAQMEALQSQARGLSMVVTLDGRKRRVPFDAVAGNILDSARAAGLPAPFACKAGVCATCRARVVAGEVEMAARYGLSDDEIAGRLCPHLPVRAERRRRRARLRRLKPGQAAEQQVHRHVGQALGAERAGGAEPGVGPVDHAEEEHRDRQRDRIELRPDLPHQLLHDRDDPPLLGHHLRPRAAGRLSSSFRSTL
jgi:hypothetical protein